MIQEKKNAAKWIIPTDKWLCTSRCSFIHHTLTFFSYVDNTNRQVVVVANFLMAAIHRKSLIIFARSVLRSLFLHHRPLFNICPLRYHESLDLEYRAMILLVEAWRNLMFAVAVHLFLRDIYVQVR